MNPMTMTTDAPSRQLDMGLALAARACQAQLPALAQRRLRGHLDEIPRLEGVAIDSEGAQRLSRRLFGLLANASVHCGGAGTLRPLFDELSRLRIYLVLQAHLRVQVPEVLRRGTPDLIAHVEGADVWIDTRARGAGVLAGSNQPRLLVVDRSGLARREPPLLLGSGYAGELHLHDGLRSRPGSHDFVLVCRSGDVHGPDGQRRPSTPLGQLLGALPGRIDLHDDRQDRPA